MEAVAAVGLASNVLQFAEFTTKLIRISNELRHHAASPENKDHQILATHLEALAQNISDSAKAISQTSTAVSPEEKALQPVAAGCCELAKSLLKRLETCGIQPGQNASRLQRVKKAFRAIWNKREIEEISNRLDSFRSELILYYAFQGRKTQLDQQARQSTTNNAYVDRLDNLSSLIEGLRHDVDRTGNSQHSEVLKSIAESRTENSQFHTRAAQQILANQTSVLGTLDSLQTSMTALNVGLQNVNTQQPETIESLARVRVENSTLLATATHQVPLAGDLGASFEYVLRPLLEEYGDKMLAEVKKEFRGRARCEMDNLIKGAFPALDEMQSRSKEAQRNAVDEMDIDETDTDSELSKSRCSSSGSHSIIPPDRRTPRWQDKNSITMLFQKRWRTETSLGIFMLRIWDRVHFDAFGRSTRIYELTAQFTPSPRWLSTGCSITYENKTDARGGPTFCFRLPKTYRVLETDHEVWDAIRDGDVSTIQSMLSQKLISPSDRDIYGSPLLCDEEAGRLGSRANSLQDWASACRFVDFDFNISGEMIYLELVVFFWSTWIDEDVNNLHAVEQFDRITLFDLIVQQVFGCNDSTNTTDIPVALAAWFLRCKILEAFDSSLMADGASSALPIPYRGHYAHPVVAQCLEFLEHVISMGIDQHPDCIFDTYYDITISDQFYNKPYQHVWEEILEEHGFDVGWVYEEDDRRQRVVTGEASAHEVSVGVDASAMRDVRRRRGYENSNE
ncbi:hypothetical protein F4677DRAFT_457542 [Hypoxylon crocopeplum]|nr:hypothetical protein F4677DRAFT_457542 [Hypoxylon crocopeplum]